MSKSAIEVVSIEFGKIIEPLKELINLQNLRRFLASIGWNWSENSLQGCDFSRLSSTLDALIESIREIDFNKGFTDQLPEFTTLTEKIVESVIAIMDITSNFPDPSQFLENASEFIAEIGIQIFNYLVCRYLEDNYPIIYQTFHFIGVFQAEKVYNAEFGYSKKYLIKWSNLVQVFTDFKGRFREEFFEEGNFKAEWFLAKMDEFMNAIGIPSDPTAIDDSIAPRLYFQDSTTEADWNPTTWEEHNLLRIPFAEISDSEVGYSEMGFLMVPIPDRQNPDKKIKGISIVPFIEGEITLEFNLTENIKLVITGSLKTGFAISIIPDKVEIIEKLYGNVGFDGKFAIEIAHISPTGKIVLFGEPGKSRFEYEKFGIKFSLITQSSGHDVELEVGITNASIVIQGSDGDGFLQKVLPKDPLRLDFEFIMGFSRSKGFYFKGGVGIELTFMIGKSLGPIFIDSVNLGLSFKDQRFNLYTAISGGVNIGPLTATIGKVGIQLGIDTSKSGALGKSDFYLEFKPPSAIGIGIDADPVSGGGFLLIDKPNYAGILSLSVSDSFDITAIGLLTTKLPDGKDGFSLVLSILTEFTPIQLGYGFALKGVGGLIGIHREMKEDALREVVKDHSLDLILFPEDPIKDAMQIINAIQTVFPPMENHYVFGPMIKIIWGSGIELISFSGGIFIEISTPIAIEKLAIMGLAKIALPDKKAPVVNLNMDILGFIDFGNESIAMDSSIFDSKILIFDISGEMALRAGWGGNKGFAFSIGGFHPRFTPPATFPALDRLMISLDKDVAKLSLEVYFAVTENSLQFGSLLNLLIAVGEFEITGGAGFDALIIFRPFSFDVDFYAWLAILYASNEILSLKANVNLVGPNQFTVKGKVKVKVLFFDVTVSFKKTFGDKKPEELPSVSPLQELKTQLADPRNIRHRLPDWVNNSFRFTKESNDYKDPSSTTVISSKVVPLTIQMDKFGGGTPPANEKVLDIRGSGVAEQVHVKTYFPPDQYIHISEDRRLSSDSYEEWPCGKEFSSSFDSVQDKTKFSNQEITIETKIIESDEYKVPGEVRLLAGRLTFRNSVGAVALRSWSTVGSRRYHTPTKSTIDPTNPNYITVKAPSYTISSQNASNGQFSRSNVNGSPAQNMTYSEAMQILERSDEGGIIRDITYVTKEDI